jgi:ABC-type phosphate transport system substrate-binding protein
MSTLKKLALASTCAWIAGAVAFAPGALAQTSPKTKPSGDIYGGGASVPAPYARQTFDCYGLPTDLIITGNPPQFVAIAPFDYTGNPSQNCATQHVETKSTIYYASASAGPGILSVFGHDPTFYGYINQGDNEYFPSIQYALSTTSLGSTDVNNYNNGGTETQGSSSITIAGQTGGPSCTSGSKTPYPNPLNCYGPLVQFPFAITPIVFAYSPTYEKWIDSNGNETDFHFNIQYGRSDNSGGLRMSPTTYCKIYNGQITNWNDPALTTDNGGVSLEDPNDTTSPWSVPLQIVGRSDSAGATSIFTRHLANVCASLSGNQYTTGTSTLPSSLRGPVYNVNNPNYPPVAGGSNPSNCTYSGATACIQLGRITYSGTDYALPYVLETQLNTYGLNTTTLENYNGQWEEGTPSTAETAYSVILPPQSSSKGKYCATCTTFGYRDDPTAWVQSTAPTSLIADPTSSGAYPIVGTANFLTYTCYASAATEKTLTGVIKYISDEPINYDLNKGILASAGLAPLSKQWREAIKTTFSTNADKLGLNIEPAGASGVCSGSLIVGG